jgi:fructose-bisphosphate aldolase class II
MVKAINLGCNGLMLDSSNLNLPDNISTTKNVVEMSHRCGVPVVGELGFIANNEDEGETNADGDTELTTPSEARAYVERTKVDFLSVAIGTVQGRMKSKAKLDFKRLKQLNHAVNIPLVIHGGTGLNVVMKWNVV